MHHNFIWCAQDKKYIPIGEPCNPRTAYNSIGQTSLWQKKSKRSFKHCHNLVMIINSFMLISNTTKDNVGTRNIAVNSVNAIKSRALIRMWHKIKLKSHPKHEKNIVAYLWSTLLRFMIGLLPPMPCPSCVARSSAFIVLAMLVKLIRVFHKEGFQLPVLSQCWKSIRNGNIFLSFLKTSMAMINPLRHSDAYVSKLVRCQAIIWTNTGLSLVEFVGI